MSEKHLILYADDDEDDRDFFKYAANKLGVDVITFIDGNALIEHLNKGQLDSPAILLIDINMPRMSGFECLKKIRETEKIKEWPAIIYSTSNDDMDMIAAQEAGADMYIVKPSNLDILQEIVSYAISIDWTVKSTPRKFIKFLKR
ncbi:MAG: response regulator [Omnitrophica WOR_2 bacterium]|jgi:DNA-binding response OmpR family regulator